VPQAFLNAAADAAGGMLLAHHARVRDGDGHGRGQLVDVAAQACLSLNTLGRVLADPVGDERPEWAALISPTARTDQSGSGTGTSSHLKKWRCKDGLVEFHLAIGQAAGPFTNNFFRWMHAEGAAGDTLLRWDWRILPELVERGEFTDADMQEVRTATAGFLAAKTKSEILQAAIAYKLLCIGVCDTADLADSPQLAGRGFYVTLGTGRRAQTMPGPWATVSVPAFELRRPAPELGEHTDEVLTEWLGYDDAAKQSLRAKGATT
jgi:crotonobetainyl-CoA:carnitine CoA-transferase CaiB-like acyl-CoA transferase